MSVRICPRCSTLIESASAIFCYNCGQELGHSGTSETTGKPKAIFSKPHEYVRKKGSSFYFFLFLIPILILFLVVSVFYLLAIRKSLQTPLLKPSSNEFVSTVSALPISPVKFGKYDFASIVPASASLYLEGNNLRLFLDKFLGSEDKKNVESKVGLNLDEVSSFFEPEFALVASPSSIALIGIGKDSDFLKERSLKLAREKIKSQVMDQYFVVSDSEPLLRDIQNTYKKISLSLTMTAKYQETVKHLPDLGQILIYSENLESTMFALKMYFGEKLRSPISFLSGTSFVITAGNGSTVIKGINGN